MACNCNRPDCFRCEEQWRAKKAAEDKCNCYDCLVDRTCVLLDGKCDCKQPLKDCKYG